MISGAVRKGLTALTLLGLGVTACPPIQAAMLVHTNDVLGDIEPCGCRTNPQGGMARKANLMKRLADQSILQLDAGDLLFSSNSLPELLAHQAELQAGYLLKSMDELGHDAAVPGEKDFALGLKSFEKLVKKTKIHFLAANLVRKNGGKIFEENAIFTRKGTDGKSLRIAVIGLVGTDIGFPRELKVLPPIPTAKKQLALLRKKADLVIFLTHQGLDADKALAKALPGIDIIVGGHTQSFLQEPIQIGQTTLYQSSFRNQYVGVLPLQKPFKGEGYKLVGLDAGYDSPTDAPSPTDLLVKEFKAAIADLNSKEDAALTANPANSMGSTPKYQTFPKCAECHLKQFDFWRKTRHAMALQPLLEKEQFRNKECLTCHTVGLGDPEGFSSVNRLADFKKAPLPQASSSPNSVEGDENASTHASEEPATEPMQTEELAKYLKAVHEAKSLKDRVRITQLQPEMTLHRSLGSIHRSWAPVQCENCHQPGRDHPFSGSYSKKVEKTTCLNCHTAERAPEWYTASGKPDWEKIETKRSMVACPAGELSESEE